MLFRDLYGYNTENKMNIKEKSVDIFAFTFKLYYFSLSCFLQISLDIQNNKHNCSFIM